MKKAKKNDNAAVLMELGALTNIYVMLKKGDGPVATVATTEELINKKLAQAQ